MGVTSAPTATAFSHEHGYELRRYDWHRVETETLDGDGRFVDVERA
ncbi:MULTISPECIES: hypothetical protein [Haloferax]|uniref:Uncharacterized protein n=1 Tax=Haloferax marinum TaxID=2666143 RepID=A0A6A8GAB9_9EURY|nr:MULTISPECIES: hypothetical protein [Haloferax]MRW97548.1 hypothetical protein [Haloferax marinum]